MLKNLKLLRDAAGVTQKTVAEAIGVSQQSINKYENHNIEPDIETLIRLAQYFQCSVDYLIGNCNHAEIQVSGNLSKEESNMIKAYRKLNATQRKAVKDIIDSYHK